MRSPISGSSSNLAGQCVSFCAVLSWGSASHRNSNCLTQDNYLRPRSNGPAVRQFADHATLSKPCVCRAQSRQQPEASYGAGPSTTVLGSLDRAAPARPPALDRPSRLHVEVPPCEDEAVSPHATTCVLLFVVLAVPTLGAGAAISRDEKRAERVRGDDDPILIPRSAALPRFTLQALDISAFDVETTGSANRQARGPRPRCDTLAWFPDREPGDDLRDAC